jgi:hypothetical protein
MDYSMKITDYNEFCKLVDNVIEGVENGNIVANPLKKEFTDLGDVVVSETAVEKGEPIREQIIEEHSEINSLKNLANLDVELVENRTVILYNTLTLQVIDVFPDASKAGVGKNIHPTTVRNKCKAKFTDPANIRWTYYYEGLIPKKDLGSDFDIDKPRKSYITDL